MLRLFYRNHSLKLILILFTLLEIFIVKFPLLNSIGYEFSLINGFLLFFFAGLISKAVFRKVEFSSFFYFLFENRLLIISFLLIPLLLSFYSTVFVTKCPVSLGIKFYFLITFFSFLYGLFFAFLSNKIFKNFTLLIFVSFIILILTLSFLEFYFYPQVYSFNPIYGFINGTIYDEDPRIDNKILYFHLYSIIVFVLLYNTLKLMMNKNYGKFKIYFVLISLIIISFILKPYLGFATNKYILEKNLLSEIETDHFKIIIDKNIPIDAKRNVALLHEYYLEQVCSTLKIKYDKKITSYIFKDNFQKGNLIGSASADIAKPWLNEIYVSYENIDETLKHEIAHVVSSEFGKTIFKIAQDLNPALTEGLAMFVENDFDGYEVDYVAFLFLKANPKFKIEKLFFNTSFFTSYSAISYVLTGSFLNFVSSHYGIDKVKDIYRENNFDSLQIENFEVLVQDYLDYLNSNNYPFNKYKAQLYFGGKSIVEKFCPRNAAYELRKANILFDQKKFNEASNLYKKIYSYSKTYQSLSGLIKSKLMLNEYESALEFLKNEIEKFRDDQFYFNLELLLSECYLVNNKIEESRFLLNKLIIQNPNNNYINEAKFKLLLISFLGKESFYYYQKSNFEKYEILTRIYSVEKKEVVLLRLIQLSQQIKKDYYQFLINISLEKNLDGFFTNLSLSKFFFMENNYDLSRKFAVDALKINVQDVERFKAIENLRMINWIINYKDEIKIRIRGK